MNRVVEHRRGEIFEDANNQSQYTNRMFTEWEKKQKLIELT